ncbi:MAG: MFS transporter [Desulfobacterales bacterium]|nr:MFS transporter [Desulfobacterales bacterium]
MTVTDTRPETADGPGERGMIIWAALLALFLGALDALVMSAAMPTIIAELGGLSLYAWVYSAYFLARAVSLPVFGKLSDLFAAKRLMVISIALFVLASAAAGASPSMGVLVTARAFQGIGAGGIFALVYVVLSDVALPGQRGKTLSLASSVWGISSLIGPTLGGFMVTYFSWRWIFYINIPLGLLSLAGIGLFFKELREKPGRANLDWAGITCFSGMVLGGLTLVMTGGREIPWDSGPGIGLILSTLILGTGFVLAERRARDPFLDFSFFRYPGFALGNLMTFGASFAIFSLFAYAPLFLQGALSQPPMVVGYAMLSLSLGWSAGSLAMGRTVDRFGARKASVTGAVFMVAGALLCLGFGRDTSPAHCFFVFVIIGLGMGFISLATLLIVQDSVGPADLGMATSFHQFGRTLGGTVGVGISGGMVTTRLFRGLENGGPELSAVLSKGGSGEMMTQLRESLSHLFQPEYQAQMPARTLEILQNAVLDGVGAAFATVAVVSACCLLLGFFLPRDRDSEASG